MGLALAAALLVLLGAHVTIVVRLGRAGLWKRAALALVVPPLAPWWSWHAGHRRTPAVWGAALALYALGVAVVALTGR